MSDVGYGLVVWARHGDAGVGGACGLDGVGSTWIGFVGYIYVL